MIDDWMEKYHTDVSKKVSILSLRKENMKNEIKTNAEELTHYTGSIQQSDKFAEIV